MTGRSATTPAALRLVWTAVAPEAVLTTLLGLGFVIGAAGVHRVASIRGLEVAIVPGRAGANDGHLEIEAASSPSVAPRHRRLARDAARLELVALGWATVDAERARDFAGVGFERAADDEALGARAWVEDLPSFDGIRGLPDAVGSRAGLDALDRAVTEASARLVLLEPSTEGPLAARLVRHGEGPAAIYLQQRGPASPGQPDVPSPRHASALGPVSRRSPFGPARLVIGPRFGPFVLVVRQPDAERG